MGKRAVEYVKLRCGSGLVTVVANGDQDGVALADHHLLDERLEVNVIGGNANGGGRCAVHLDITRKALCGDSKGEAVGLARCDCLRVAIHRKFGGFRAKICHVNRDGLFSVIDLIGVIEAVFVRVEIHAFRGDRIAAIVAKLHHKLYLTVDHLGVEGGNVSAGCIGIVYHDGIAPFAVFTEHSLDKRARKRFAVLLPRFVFYVQECADAVGIGQHDVAVAQHRSLRGQIERTIQCVQALGDRVGAVVKDLPVMAFHRACLGNLVAVICAVLQHLQGAIATVGEVTVKVKDVINTRFGRGNIYDRGKAIHHQYGGCRQLPARRFGIILQVRRMKRVCVCLVNVRGIGRLVIVVVGGYAEDIVVAVLRPYQSRRAVHHRDLHRVLIVAVLLAVHDCHDLCGIGKIHPFERKSFGACGGVVDVFGGERFGLLRVGNIDLILVLQERIGRVGLAVILKDGIIAPSAVLPRSIYQLDAVIGVIAVHGGEIELVVGGADLNDLRVFLTVGGIAVRGSKEHSCVCLLFGYFLIFLFAADDVVLAGPNRDLLFIPQKLDVSAELTVDLPFADTGDLYG